MKRLEKQFERKLRLNAEECICFLPLPVCAPLRGCCMQRALAVYPPPVARSPLECSRPCQRNRSDFHRKSELQSRAQKVWLRSSLRRNHAAALKSCPVTPRCGTCASACCARCTLKHLTLNPEPSTFWFHIRLITSRWQQSARACVSLLRSFMHAFRLSIQ